MSSIKLTADSGGGTVELKAPATTTGNAAVLFKLPLVDGSSGQALTTNASGQLSFSSVAAGGASNIAFDSGYGIDFSATANSGGTSASELFDDYEEGTWDPTFSRANGYNMTSGYQTRKGTYVKIGKSVTCVFNLYTTSGIAGSSYYWLTGLPFTADTGDSGSIGDSCAATMSRLYIVNSDRAGGSNAMNLKMQSGGTNLLLKSRMDNSWLTSGAGNVVLWAGMITYFTAT